MERSYSNLYWRHVSTVGSKANARDRLSQNRNGSTAFKNIMQRSFSNFTLEPCLHLWNGSERSRSSAAALLLQCRGCLMCSTVARAFYSFTQRSVSVSHIPIWLECLTHARAHVLFWPIESGWIATHGVPRTTHARIRATACVSVCVCICVQCMSMATQTNHRHS